MNATQTSIANRPRPPGRPPRQPSGRNFELYHELVYEGRAAALVAARFRVSRQRVTEVRGQIAAWVENSLPNWVVSENPPMSVGNRFHLVIALRRVQLNDAYRNYLDQFGGRGGAAAFGHLLAADDAGFLPREFAARLPRRDLLSSALRMSRELDDLAHVARRGPFFHLPDELREAERQQNLALAPGKDNSPPGL